MNKEANKTHANKDKSSDSAGNSFKPTPKQASRRPLFIVLGVVVLMAIVMGYTLSNRMKTGSKNTSREETKVSTSLASTLFAQGDEAGIIEAEAAPPLLDDTPEDTLIVPESLNSGQTGYSSSGGAQKSEAQQRREMLALAAKEADTTVYVSNPANVTIDSTRQSSPSSASTPLMAELQNLYQRKAEAENRLNSLTGKGKTNSRTPSTSTNDTTYLPHRRTAPASNYVIRQGTVIPSVMVSGINSELPGQILAQVRENVYDTATGRYLLIPQGSRLSGTYENKLNSGQNRVYVVWNRLIFPDGSALTLEGMPGTDQAGYGGFRDKTNHHLASTYAQALLLSAFSAGVQLSQPRPEPGETTVSAQQIGAAALGQQLGQLGMEQARQNLRRQPTLEIRPGYPFNVMVNQDVILTPWNHTKR